jgi:hypothetical protein
MSVKPGLLASGNDMHVIWEIWEEIIKDIFEIQVTQFNEGRKLNDAMSRSLHSPNLFKHLKSKWIW